MKIITYYAVNKAELVDVLKKFGSVKFLLCVGQSSPVLLQSYRHNTMKHLHAIRRWTGIIKQ